MVEKIPKFSILIRTTGSKSDLVGTQLLATLWSMNGMKSKGHNTAQVNYFKLYRYIYIDKLKSIFKNKKNCDMVKTF